MDYSHAPETHDFIARHVKAVQHSALDGQLLGGLFIGQVTDIEDPKKLNRIKVKLHFQDEEGMAEMQTDWLKQITLFAGPTDTRRGIEAWGLDYPLPEVHQDVVVFFNGGDPYDGFWWGVPRYREDERSVPRIEKDKKKQFSFRMKLPNGFEFCIETGGSVGLTIFGHCVAWVKGHLDFGARGRIHMLGTRIVQGALSVLKKVSPQMPESHYIRASDDPELREQFIDLMDGTPGQEDPGIRKPEPMS